MMGQIWAKRDVWNEAMMEDCRRAGQILFKEDEDDFVAFSTKKNL